MDNQISSSNSVEQGEDVVIIEVNGGVEQQQSAAGRVSMNKKGKKKLHHHRHMASFLQLSIIILSVFVLLRSSSALPYIVFHGINEDCSDRKDFIEVLSYWSGSAGYCIEIGNGRWDSMFMTLTDQARVACDKVKQMKELSDGYNLIGLSQGNMIARGVIELCDGGPPVKNYIALGGPHSGIASIPYCKGKNKSPLCKFADVLLKLDIYDTLVQSNLAPSGYVKIPTKFSSYLKRCSFLPKLNNEMPEERNATYKDRFTSLQNLVLIKFENDTVLIPKESAWFGYYPEGAYEPVLSPRQTNLYKEDWIGLKTLDDAGKVKFVSVPGSHLGTTLSEKKQYIVPYLK